MKWDGRFVGRHAVGFFTTALLTHDVVCYDRRIMLTHDSNDNKIGKLVVKKCQFGTERKIIGFAGS